MKEFHCNGGGSEGAHRKVRYPRFHKARHGGSGGGGGGGGARGQGPTVHVTCAQNMFKARAERAQVCMVCVVFYFEVGVCVCLSIYIFCVVCFFFQVSLL